MFAEWNNILAHMTAFFQKARIPCDLKYVPRRKSNIIFRDLFGGQNFGTVKQNTSSF